ncbi:MAG: hypothetical protein GY702_00235 [Desulfobulbaceae bacterium]|nr:hypothetical protein [Desulfobulbaceae bacterium]
MANLENVVEKLTVTINKIVVRVDKDRQQHEAEWQENKQSAARLWGTVHQMERDSASQERIIQGLERSVQFHEQRSVAHQGQLNELKNAARAQEQKIATQHAEIQKLRELVQNLEQVQISQQQESSHLRQQVDREVHRAESLPEGGLEREPRSCLDLPHDLHKHNETGPIPGGDYSSLVEEVARRSQEQIRRQALQEENRKDSRQRVSTPMAASSPARETTGWKPRGG